MVPPEIPQRLIPHLLRLPTHEILKVTTVSGVAYAIDISGAQYGYPEPVTLWDEYAATRVQEIKNCEDAYVVSSRHIFQ